MKPFKPPTVVRRTPSNNSQSNQAAEPPSKKRRISDDNRYDHDTKATAAAAQILRCPSNVPKKFVAPPARKPLEDVTNSSSPSPHSESGVQEYYTVLWRKFTTKKNKTWDGDGVLCIRDGYATLQDISGKDLGRTTCKGPLLAGSELKIGGKDVEIEGLISKKEYLAGRVFLGTTKSSPPQTLKPSRRVDSKASNDDVSSKKPLPSQEKSLKSSIPTTQATRTAFKAPLINNVESLPPKDLRIPSPRHDPQSPGALVMKRPSSAPKGKQIVDVVVDPLLSKKLREHQRVGVSFLYECVMGMKGYCGEGAILADEMGVGKTLQTIALLWTLLKQNPIYGDSPVVKKALIVCPVSLISNWRKEFNKWLGRDRIGVFVAGENKFTRLEDFTKGKVYSVMIIGYEKLRTMQDDLQKGSGIDIVIADEGHRLKTAQNKSAMAIKSLNTERRIILSGTPIQNDLTEFYTMVDFVNPGMLNKYSTFKRVFETPILKSRQPGASESDVEKGEARSQELADITSMFILRRTADILSKYLPAKTEYVVFCRPAKAQIAIYRAITGSSMFGLALGSPAVSLELITILKKVCNSPSLLLGNGDKDDTTTASELVGELPRSLLCSPAASGKLQVLQTLLHQIRTTTDEKVVLVSNYTSTLDILATTLSSQSYTSLRLDGSTPASKRQELVDRFNKLSSKDAFVFLLSAKAGGLGLNLIGASRLVLFDLDWNPSTDLQAMARVHRDGQKRPCYIYRLVTQGTLDEKIFQRQVSKIGLADSIVDGKDGVSGMTREELRDIFSLDEGNDCQTHRLLRCDCGGIGTPLLAPSEDETEEVEHQRNDLAMLAAASGSKSNSDDSIEVVRLDEEDETLPLRRSHWKSAKDYDWEAEEANAVRRSNECRDSNGKAKMLSLMQYTHFDTALVRSGSDKQRSNHESGDNVEDADDSREPEPIESAIEDAALRSVLRQDAGKVGFVFTKLSV